MIDEMYSLNTSPKVRFPDRIHATEILDTMTTQGEKEGMDHEEGNNKINRETTPTQNKGLKRNIKERLTRYEEYRFPPPASVMNANNKIKNPNSRYQSLHGFTKQDFKELSNMFLTENSNTILVNSFYKTGKL